ncbi:protein unc-50 homolog isoform X1 [Sitophilus oryzae]|uniref:Protein unc-50 homolog isoform X1 n=1 Tax=Sitophilus oryzae TaxID=7048 RepID=A0A6J2XFF8_SITOR|nr:protein unc-50 homolog isoform X1 [Sitophilus oryzae]
MGHKEPLLLSQSNVNSAYQKFRRYFRRVFKFEQMDFQFAFWQMFYLLAAPQKLTKVFRARKNFKSQFARDDPAFLILFAAALIITSIGFSLRLSHTFGQFLVFLVLEIFLDCIGVGVIIATILWYITNKFLKPKNLPQDVEWGFAFDIHLNAYFPPLMLLHFVMILFYNFFVREGNFFSIFLGNSVWLAASIYYVYITFLGYHSMQILRKINLFLIPIPLLVIVYIITIFLQMNVSSIVFESYYSNRLGW